MPWGVSVSGVAGGGGDNPWQYAPPPLFLGGSGGWANFIFYYGVGNSLDIDDGECYKHRVCPEEQKLLLRHW